MGKLRTQGFYDFTEAKFYCSYALAEGPFSIQIRENIAFSSNVLPNTYLHHLYTAKRLIRHF